MSEQPMPESGPAAAPATATSTRRSRASASTEPTEPTADRQDGVDEGAEGDEDAIPEPEQPVEIEFDLAAPAVTVLAPVRRDADYEIADDHALAVPADEEEIPVNGVQVEWMTAAVAPHGFALSINDTPYLFTPQMAAALKGYVDKAIVGLSL